MAFTLSPNMNLPIPGVGTEAGPNYAFDVNSSLTLLDQHDHSPGAGVQITPSGLNINDALSFNGNSLTDVSTIVFEAVASSSTLQSLYVAPGSESPLTEDLWFTDGNGIPVQITSGGLVNATIASIPGESYSGGTFFWKQGAGSTTPANFDIGSIILRPTVAGTTFGVQLDPPAAISSQYNIALPILPAVNSFMAIDNAGIITASIAISQGITNTNIANNTITGIKLVDHTIGLTQLATTVLQWNVQTFTSSGTFNVPADVNQVYVLAAGGGGGGASGGTTTTNGGGGGGAGGLPILLPLTVTPLGTVSVTIGVGGTGAVGGAGGAGGTTVVGSLSFPGGKGGGAATAGTSAGLGGAGGLDRWYSNIGAAGGNGGFSPSQAGIAGSSGELSPFSTAGVGGSVTAVNGTGGGGGGGSAGFGAGANGGAGSTTISNAGTGGNTAAVNSSGGGGGGGGAGRTSGTAGAGGNGGSGKVILYWLGAP